MTMIAKGEEIPRRNELRTVQDGVFTRGRVSDTIRADAQTPGIRLREL